MAEDENFQSYCEKEFEIDSDLDGGIINVKGEKFDRIFKDLYQELKTRGPENFLFICIVLDRKVRLPVCDGFITDNEIDFFEFCENPEKYINLFVFQGANPAGYVCIGHYGKDRDGDSPLFVESCRGCRYLTEVR